MQKQILCSARHHDHHYARADDSSALRDAGALRLRGRRVPRAALPGVGEATASVSDTQSSTNLMFSVMRSSRLVEEHNESDVRASSR